jgi:hypothetical protein
MWHVQKAEWPLSKKQNKTAAVVTKLQEAQWQLL